MSKPQSPMRNPAPTSVRTASVDSDFDVRRIPTGFLVRVRRPDGLETVVHVQEEDHLQRLLNLAEGEFGDKSIVRKADRDA
jgi:hypothetical protein